MFPKQTAPNVKFCLTTSLKKLSKKQSPNITRAVPVKAHTAKYAEVSNNEVPTDTRILARLSLDIVLLGGRETFHHHKSTSKKILQD